MLGLCGQTREQGLTDMVYGTMAHTFYKLDFPRRYNTIYI